MKCECERCKSNRDHMVSQACTTVVFGIIRESMANIFKKQEDKDGK